MFRNALKSEGVLGQTTLELAVRSRLGHWSTSENCFFVESCFLDISGMIFFLICKQQLTSRLQEIPCVLSMFTVSSYVALVHVLCQEMGRVGKLSRGDDPKWSTYR